MAKALLSSGNLLVSKGIRVKFFPHTGGYFAPIVVIGGNCQNTELIKRNYF